MTASAALSAELFSGALPWLPSGASPGIPRFARVAPVAAEASDERDEERALAARAQAGDRAALGELLRRHGPRLYRAVLLPRLGSRAAAEEALSVTYMKVVERFAQFSWQDVGVYPWLRVVALRVALDQLRARKREVLFEPADLERELEHARDDARQPDVLERHDLAIARERVERVLARLNPRYSLAIRLRVLEERSREEAARELEVSVGTLDVVLHRAMAALRKALSQETERAG
ncbi:MAG: RNA polymerase sigma factor [Sorangiineae bacterium]|nr:RNA polymerase sigma factor [Polyangiaceae bacterium]MEB2324274.1 RNA polymerase sigma factor [Sorangiineae bacterium]